MFRKVMAFLGVSLMAAMIASLPGVVRVQHAAAAYTMTLLNNGTELWTLVTTGTAGQVQLIGDGNPVMTLDNNAGILVNVGTVAQLQSCSTAIKGAMSMVTDANSATFNAAVAGGGANIMLAVCNGTGWKIH